MPYFQGMPVRKGGGVGIRKTDGVPPPKIPEGDYGPKFKALSKDRHRAFVLALVQQGSRDYTAAYKLAGYLSADEFANQEASRLAHDTRIQEALHEEASRRLHGLVPLALRTVGDIMENENAKDADRLKASLGVMDRAGLHTTTEHKITLELADDPEMLAQIKLLAERNGIPLERLLGARLSKVVEGEYTDITPNDD
jgi:hypothetical protein